MLENSRTLLMLKKCKRDTKDITNLHVERSDIDKVKSTQSVTAINLENVQVAKEKLPEPHTLKTCRFGQTDMDLSTTLSEIATNMDMIMETSDLDEISKNESDPVANSENSHFATEKPSEPQTLQNSCLMQKFHHTDMDLSASFSEIAANIDMETADLDKIDIFTEDGLNLNNIAASILDEEKIAYSKSTLEEREPDYEEADDTDKNYVPSEEDESEEDMKDYEDEKTWSLKNRKERKENRNTGKEYKTVKGNIKIARKMRPLKICKKKCSQKISEEQRAHIFETYWALGSYEKRKSFLLDCVTVVRKKISRTKEDGKKHKNRENTYIYGFKVENREELSVCKQCFLSTLGESEKFLSVTVTNKLYSPLGVIKDDLRGKHEKTRLSKEKIEKVKKHIASFPAYESHYTRRHTNKRYLATHLNLNIMYKLYCETEENPVSLSSYRNEFKKTGLRFKKPALDTCSTCDALNLTVKSKDEIVRKDAEEKLKNHQMEADEAYERKKEDKITSLETQGMKVLVFDLQQVLPTPLLTSGDVFYKRQFSVYNLTVHDCTTGKSTHYMWDESLAKRGSIEIASCIYNILMNMPPDIESIILFSDTCGGQNKNSNFIAMLMYVVKTHPTLKTVDHKFLIAGHTHMECDSDHALIERKSKRSPFPIYHPRDWQQLVRIASTQKNKFEVKAMTQSEFFDFSDLFKKCLQKKKLDMDHEQFNFRHIRWLRFSNTEDFGIFSYKTSLDPNIPFKKMSYQRKKKTAILPEYKLPLPYTRLLPISEAKKQNLLSLLDKVDYQAAEFYKNLPTANDIPDCDPDLDLLEPESELQET